MKKWLAILVLSVLSVASHAGVGFVNGAWISDSGTEADPYELGALVGGSSTRLRVGVVGLRGADFEEHASFVVAQDSMVFGAANTFTLSILGVNVFDIADFGVELWNNSHPDGTTMLAAFDGNNSTVNLGTLLAGSYHLDMFGTMGASMGVYTVTLHAMPVPEPSTYALLLAGLGAVVFVARRRREMM